MKLKREHIVPGKVVQVRQSHSLILDAHRYLLGESTDLPSGRFLGILTAPRQVDGVNLVRVLVNGRDEHEVFYCDILKNCE